MTDFPHYLRLSACLQCPKHCYILNIYDNIDRLRDKKIVRNHNAECPYPHVPIWNNYHTTIKWIEEKGIQKSLEGIGETKI